MTPPTNNGKVWRNKPAVQIQERRKPEHRRYDDGGEIDWAVVWIAIVGLAVVVAVFFPVLGDQW